MGHWSPTTLGNDGASDAIASFVRVFDTPQLRSMLEEAFAPPAEGGAAFDEAEAAYALAVAELVAAGLRAPSDELSAKALKWAKFYRAVLAPWRDRAVAAVNIAAASPYATMWLRDGGNEAFAASVGDLRERLQAATVPPMPSAKMRFLKRLDELTQPRGWRLRAGRSMLVRPFADGGEQRVRCVLNGKNELWTATLQFEIAFVELQTIVQTAAGVPTHGRDSCVLRHHPDRSVYAPSGNAEHLTLWKQGFTPPPQAELDAAGLSLSDAWNPDETVFPAAERAFAIIEEYGTPWFDAYPTFAHLRPLAERRDLEELGALCPIGALNNWFGVAWTFDPAWGRDLIRQQRERNETAGAAYAAQQGEILDRIDAALDDAL